MQRTIQFLKEQSVKSTPKGFEAVVKQAQPMAIMTSYSQNNGRPAADDYDLCTAFARDEWGFQGIIALTLGRRTVRADV